MPEKFPGRDSAALCALISDARVGHFAFVVDGQPRVLPIAVVQAGDDILLHGSTGSRWLRLLATGIPVALSVTALDALVVARSAFESSMHYRSAVLFGRCTPSPTRTRCSTSTSSRRRSFPAGSPRSAGTPPRSSRRHSCCA